MIVLRAASLLAFAAPMLARVRDRDGRPESRARPARGGRAPLAANFAAFVAFLVSLAICAGTADGSVALLAAASGALVAAAGAWIVFRSRAALGSAWSFVPKAGEDTGLITSGPYRLVRHPIYLGLILLATGEAIAFSNWPAALIVLVAILPTFVWRARLEEELLGRTFGERYAVYREQTRMILPFVL